MDIEKHIEILNNLIYESVEHGGDAGGAYYSNTENILKAINEYLKFFHLEDDQFQHHKSYNPEKF